MAITDFRKNYFWLSNFYPAQVEYDGITYQNNEAAYQAQKVQDPKRRSVYANLSAREARDSGQIETLDPNWDKRKYQIMYDVNYAKFTQNKDLGEMLLKTGDEELIEGNTWGDKYWGVCRGEGENNLGKILMDIRSKIKEFIH